MNIDKDFLEKLTGFLREASKATYAGDGPEAEPQRKGFKELEYRDGEWYYRDSYTGFFQSWGQEVVWYQDKPVWTALYGGGMAKKYHGNKEFAHQTFEFLKAALRTKEEPCQPRGPKQFKNGDWEYHSEMKGDITEFKGSEKILYKDEVVFTHDFIGGLVISR